jgi:hypothetical protein
MATLITPQTPGLLTASAAYKPFRYPWAYDMWKKQQQVHWMPRDHRHAGERVRRLHGIRGHAGQA